MITLLSYILGFRKFIIMVAFVATMIIFRLKNLISGTDFASNLQIAVTAFMGANIGEHITDTVKVWLGVKSQNPQQNVDSLPDDPAS